MELFAVFKYAVYRHECGGIFSTLEAANKAAAALIAGEPDAHHGYEVVPFTLDAVTPQTPKVPYGGGDLIESDRVSHWTRTGDKVVHVQPRPA